MDFRTLSLTLPFQVGDNMRRTEYILGLECLVPNFCVSSTDIIRPAPVVSVDLVQSTEY